MIYCRLGNDSAKAYRDCPVDHWSKKKQNTVAEKAQIAAQYTENFEITATEIAWNITLSYDVGMVKRFERGLRFIYDKLAEYVQDYFPYTLWTRVSLRGVYRCRRYYPLLLRMRQYDCQSLLGAVIYFARTARPVIADCRDPVKLNKYIHFAHTIDFYLKSVKRRNPCLWLNPPHHIRKVGR